MASISISNLIATYNSSRDPVQWKSGDVTIRDRDLYSGYIEFLYKLDSPIWVTYGFYLNVLPESRRQYTYVSEILVAAPDWTKAWKYLPDRPFQSFDLADGRNIDTLKEVWSGQDLNLGRRYTADEWTTGDRGLLACPYGIYYHDGRWWNHRSGASYVYESSMQLEVDWINLQADWWLNQTITVDEWDNATQLTGNQHAAREAIAGRCGIMWYGDHWWDSKWGDTQDDLTSAAVVDFINSHKLTALHRLASYGDADVYVVDVPRPEVSWLNVERAVVTVG